MLADVAAEEQQDVARLRRVALQRRLGILPRQVDRRHQQILRGPGSAVWTARCRHRNNQMRKEILFTTLDGHELAETLLGCAD